MRKELNIIGKKKIFLSISAILVLSSIVSVIVFGFEPGIDFVGGSLWQIRIEKPASVQELEQFFAENTNAQDVHIQKDESTEGGFVIKMKSISEDEHQQYLNKLKEKFGGIEEVRFESIGPAVGAQLRNRAIKAAVLVLLGISLYIAFAFRKVSYPVKSWKYGVITLITLFHDISIPIGILAALGYYYGIEIDTNFIVALLVIMGFSVHDTIVVFDRIRENLLTAGSKLNFDEVVNKSINQTLARSINTSFTLLLVLLALIFIGAGPLNMFVFTMIVGTLVGTYSSIFVASPILTLWQRFSKNNK